MSRAYVELIHDEYVNVVWPVVWPDSEPLRYERFRNIDLLESAVGRPFQTFCGREFYPTIPQKAAALFHSLVCNHAFQDGNKCTAVIATDQFFAVNSYFISIDSTEMYEIAKTVASHNERAISTEKIIDYLSSIFDEKAVSFEALKGIEDPAIVHLLELYVDIAERIKNSPLNKQPVE